MTKQKCEKCGKEVNATCGEQLLKDILGIELESDREPLLCLECEAKELEAR